MLGGKVDDLNKAISTRIEELTTEIQEMATKKEQYQRALRELDVRITQMIGGLEELNKLVMEKDSDVKL